MKTPPFLLGAALLFWGWQCGYLALGAMMAVLLEAARATEFRWEFSDKDYFRIWDLSMLLLLGGAIYFYTERETKVPIFPFLQAWPLFLFPIAAAQAFGTRQKLPYQAFSWFLRRQKSWDGKGMNVSHLYFALCLLAACSTNGATPAFSAVFAILVGWALWAARPQRFRPIVFAVVFAGAVAGGLGIQQSLRSWQSFIETGLGNWLGGLARRDTNARESRTAIGDIGRLKASGHILLRVEGDGTNAVPTLLRQASYTLFRDSIWTASTNRDFVSLTIETNDSWRLLNTARRTRAVFISGPTLQKGKNILAVPGGTARIDYLPFNTVERSRLGVVRAEDGPGFVRFKANYAPNLTIDSPPTEEDSSSIPEAEAAAVKEVAAALQVSGKSDAEKMRAIARLFANNFHYSTYLTSVNRGRRRNTSPLSTFLQVTHSGHCEYFGTSTVLLLRAVGIPSRYATGFSVQESERTGKKYIVRERHCHAWALAWNAEKKVWDDFDTTPASWEAEERAHASDFEQISDFFSGLWFKISEWRWGKTNFRDYLMWALVPLVAVLAWRIIFNRSRQRSRQPGVVPGGSVGWPGLDSEFYEIERELGRRGFPRSLAESVAEWCRRIESDYRGQSLAPVLLLHTRYRFDPKGLNGDERQALSEAVRRWLEELRRPPAR